MTSETALQQQIRLEASRLGVYLWRNNTGACYDDQGRLIRYGLGNDSAKINKQFKSPDLVGLTPVVVTPEMVGQVVAIFTGVEVKKPGWRHPSNEREQAQLRFLELVNQQGGLAGFAADMDTFRRIVGK